MKLIAHRGNINGPNIETENTLDQIEYCINLNFDVEIDLWKVDNKLYLGHDNPVIIVSKDFLLEYKDFLWIHCKNLNALEYMRIYFYDYFNYFWHENDQFTLTSQNYIWSYPEKMSEIHQNTLRRIFLHFGKLTEKDINYLEMCKFYGLCTDYL